MKRINKIFPKVILAVFIFLTGQACVDLEEDTSSILQLENLRSEADIVAALAPMFRDYGDVSPGHIRIIGFGADDVTTRTGGNKEPIRIYDKFNYGKGENADIPWLSDTWDMHWQIIYYANSLIDGLKTSTAPEKVVKVADAEARFWRALCYMYLVRGWGNMPAILDGMEPTGEETRATVLENYQHIEADLKIAEANLPAPGQTANQGRVSSAAAKTALADLYLTWAGWPIKDNSKYQLAAAKAKEIIDMGYFELLPLDLLWLEENGNSRETLFAIQFSRSEDIRGRMSVYFALYESRGYNEIIPERQFFYDFPEGFRKEITFDTIVPNLKVSNGKMVDRDPPAISWEDSRYKHPAYKKFYIGADWELDDRPVDFRPWQLYRYAEVLLIYAEASARAGGGTATGQAVEAYNQVRRRAAGLPYDQPDASVDVASVSADEIVAEKGWELAGENKRWYDLVRLEKVAEVTTRRDPTEEVKLTRTASEITWEQYIATIPFSTISSSNLLQNPEGFKAQ